MQHRMAFEYSLGNTVYCVLGGGRGGGPRASTPVGTPTYLGVTCFCQEHLF